MVLDLISALGLAGNIVQFVEFCGNVVSESRKNYRSTTETSIENAELESIAEDLRRLTTQLHSSDRNRAISAAGDKEFAKLLGLCNEVADELLRAVELLKVKQGPHRKWKSFRQAFLSVLSKDKLARLQYRLAAIREQINLHLVSSISHGQNRVLDNIENLRKEAQLMDVDRQQKLNDISEALRSIRVSHSSMPDRHELNRIHQTLQDSALATTGISKEIEILQSLRYKSMTVRHSKITEAYNATFRWIFHTDKFPLHDARSKVGFGRWLLSEGGMFWVSGKAGSGKSTLMKYICDNTQTTASLHQWAGSARLVTASFYFWNAGTDMQKSQQGLLQSLLYEILERCPELIPTVFHDRWHTNAASSKFQRSEVWRPIELSRAFERLQDWASMNTKFCFFIDELDEYDGDHFELIDNMMNIVRSPHIKLCVSSRPWNCFEDAFGKEIDRKLYLQDLTRQDIEIYVKNKLARPMTWATTQRNAFQYQELVLDIVKRAQGVFLWVFLVVRSLQEGLANGDSITMLQSRLQSLPADLELFFEHILNSVDDVYQEKLSAMFQHSLQARGPLSLMIYSFLDEEDPDFAIKLPPTPMTATEIHSRHEEMRRRINGRSKVLLEVSAGQHDGLFNMYDVEFLHRTVRDFLQTKDTQIKLQSMTSGTYNPCLALSRAHLAAFKTRPEDAKETSVTQSEVWDDLLGYAQKAEDQRGVADGIMLDELERTSKVRYRLFLQSSFFFLDPSFLEHVVGRGFVHYVNMRLSRRPQLLLSQRGSLLLTAITNVIKPSFRGMYKVDLTHMVQMLLKHGLSPNKPLSRSTIWRLFMKAYPPESADSEEHTCWRNVLRILLLGGADVQESTVLLDLLLNQKTLSERTPDPSGNLVSTIELLLSHGLDPNQPVSVGMTIWTDFLDKVFGKEHWIEENGICGVISTFLRYGADPLATFFSIPQSKRVPMSLIISRFKNRDEGEALYMLMKKETAYLRSRDQYVRKTIYVKHRSLSRRMQ